MLVKILLCFYNLHHQFFLFKIASFVDISNITLLYFIVFLMTYIHTSKKKNISKNQITFTILQNFIWLKKNKYDNKKKNKLENIW
jgi:hypothetical protein